MTVAAGLVSMSLVVCPIGVPAHPVHVSLAEVEYNRDTGMLEVALRMHVVDVEQALTRERGQVVDVDDEPTRDKLLKQYVSRHFRLEPTRDEPVKGADSKPDTDPKPDTDSKADPGSADSGRKSVSKEMRWVGSEVTRRDVWAYFELRVEQADQEVRLRNDLFLEFQADQVNAVRLAVGRQRKTLFFREKTTRQVLPLSTLRRRPADGGTREAPSTVGRP